MLPRRSRQMLPTVHRAADPEGDAHWAVRVMVIADCPDRHWSHRAHLLGLSLWRYRGKCLGSAVRQHTVR